MNVFDGSKLKDENFQKYFFTNFRKLVICSCSLRKRAVRKDSLKKKIKFLKKVVDNLLIARYSNQARSVRVMREIFEN